MRIAQEKELLNIENAQKLQFQEFSESWDKYMASYEATAFELIEDMRQKQDHEQQALLDKIRREMKYKPHKDLVTLRNQEKIFFAVKEYDNAQFMRMKANEQEMYEMSQYELEVMEQMQRESQQLR